MEIIKKNEIIKRLQTRCQEKTAHIKRLSESAKYYQRRVVTLKNLLQDLKKENLITNKVHEVLNVNKQFF